MNMLRVMALAIALSVVGASTAAALEISEATHANYQQYLKTIGSTKRGAFAVASDEADSPKGEVVARGGLQLLNRRCRIRRWCIQ